MPKVYCDDSTCAFWKEGEEEVFIKYHRDYQPLKGMGFSGECIREEVGVKARDIREGDKTDPNHVLYHLPTCRCYSQKGIKGHIDMSRFVNPQGGRLLGSQEHDSST